MKTKILLMFCIMQLLSISIYGQGVWDYHKEGNNLVIDGGGIKRAIPLTSSGKMSSNSTSTSWGNYWSNLGSDMGSRLGSGLTNIFLNWLASPRNSVIYYDNKGIPYSSAKAALAANLKYAKEELFKQGRKDFLEHWKGEVPVSSDNLAFKGTGTTNTNALEFKVIGKQNTGNRKTQAQSYIPKSNFDSMKEFAASAGINIYNYFSEAEYNKNPGEMTTEEMLIWNHKYNRLVNDMYGGDLLALPRELTDTIIDGAAKAIASIPSDITPAAMPFVFLAAHTAMGLNDYFYGQNLDPTKIIIGTGKDIKDYAINFAESKANAAISERVVTPTLSFAGKKATEFFGKDTEMLFEGKAVTYARDAFSDKITEKLTDPIYSKLNNELLQQ